MHTPITISCTYTTAANSTAYNDAVAESKDRVVRMEQRLHSAEAAEQEAAQVYMFITVGPMKKLSAGGEGLRPSPLWQPAIFSYAKHIEIQSNL